MEKILCGHLTLIGSLHGTWAVALIVYMCFGLSIGSVQQSMGQEVDWRSLSAVDLTKLYVEQDRRGFNTILQEDLIDHAWSKFLANDDYLDAAEASEVIGLIKPMAKSFSQEQKQQLSSMLEARIIANPELYAELSIWTVWRLRSCWSGMEVSKENILEWTRDWLVSADNWKQSATHGEINMLLDWSITVQNQAGYDMSPVLNDIYGYIGNKALNDPAWLNENGTIGMKKMVLRIADRVTKKERERVLKNVVGLVVENRTYFLTQDVWSMDRLREMAEPLGVDKTTWDGWVLDWFTNSDAWLASSSNQLNMLYNWLASLDESAHADAAMSELGRYAAKKLADSPELDGSQWYFKSLGVLFKTEEQQAYLLTLLMDEKNLPRRNIGRVLSTAYRGTPSEDSWHAFIEQQVEKAGDSPDGQAIWMLVRAEAVARKTSKDDGMEAIDWATRGVVAAGSDEIRLACLEWIVNEYTKAGLEEDALRVVREHAGRFENEMFHEQLGELERMMSVDER